MPDDHLLDEVAAWIRGSERVVALTGAGISTDSGIPDFRGPQGVWTKNPAAEKQATLQHYMGSREVRIGAWANRLTSPIWDAAPGPGHVALAQLERKGKLDTLVTQNVDGLHHKAGSNPNTIVEVHGNVREVMCMTCGDRDPMETALQRVRDGEEDPQCVRCGGILKSATISFGQMLDPDVIARAEAAARRADVLLAVGTSLTVTPVAYLPEYALGAGARLVIVNAQATPFDPHAHAVFHDEIREVLPELVDRV
ncbi:MAG TPA: Sir2 family NAD-dependent protein deacetylase [Acidimicrobiia bacterium]|nr:Sir2 family NAD-dependent protein deacetylase [Acidimicrobiia bacterium]